MPITAILGSRQIGKTTLALQVSQIVDKETHYLDLELDTDYNKLDDAEAFLRRFTNKLLIIDEVQRKPDLFPLLRGLVDIRKRKGEKHCQFLLLGSASKDLVLQSSESLAGRIRFLELSGFTLNELQPKHSEFDIERLWLRGGFPDSYLATSDQESWQWRNDFVRSYVEKDLPMMASKISSVTMRRLWSMLAHYNAQQVNFSKLGSSLNVSYKTVRNYIDLLTDFYMLRQIQPWSGNSLKRLVKSPKIYLRDSGIAHMLLNVFNIDELYGHPAIGASWEAFVLENIINQLSNRWQYSYYRTSAQAEIDLILEGPNGRIIAIEIKRSSAPKVSKGFHLGCKDINATDKIVIYSGNQNYPMSNGVAAMGLANFINKILT